VSIDGGVDVSATVSSGGTEVLVNQGQQRDTTVSKGGTELVSSGGYASSTTVSSGGIEIIVSGGVASSTTALEGGTETVSEGTTEATAIDGGTLVLSAGATASEGITFSGSGGTVDIADSTASVPAAISGFTVGDSIDFGFLTYSADDTYSVSGDLVTISAGDTPYALTIHGATANGFALTEGTDNELVLVVCYYPGTLIRTPSGDVAVEALSIGSDVVTADGRTLHIRWIGRNTVSTRFADPLRVMPIRIRASALANNMPERDLLVSPELALLVDDILVQAGAIVNSTSINRERDVPETFVYYHVELAEHALLLAEGTPAETFVDNIHHMVFDNWEEHEALYSDVPIGEMNLPRAQSRRQVPAEIHARLRERAGKLLRHPTRQVG
jgi:autotransporter passenger strand-loop-strand repeat protein